MMTVSVAPPLPDGISTEALLMVLRRLAWESADILRAYGRGETPPFGHPEALSVEQGGSGPVTAADLAVNRQLLDGLAVGKVVDQRRAVVQPVHVRNQVVPGVRFALLLEAAVQVAAMDVGAHHAFAIQLGNDLHRAVRGRVGRADVDDDRVFPLRALEDRAHGVGDGSVGGVHAAASQLR
jgi:hypothetical protein